MAVVTSPFTEEDSKQAFLKWHANCGPNALAFACGLHIEQVRGVIPGFETKQYTSPTMMRAALETLGKWFTAVGAPKPKPGAWASVENMFHPHFTALVRIQWEGPWTEPGANPKWAYRHSHWIATWECERTGFVFDVNGGVRNFQSWDTQVAPAIAEQIERASGVWYPTHIWRINP